MSSADEHFSLRLSDSDADNQTQEKQVPSPVFGGKKTVKRFNRKPAQVRIKFIKNCAKELVRNPVYNRKKFVKGWSISKSCGQAPSRPISKQQKATVETTNTSRTSSELRVLENAEVHNKKNANNQSAPPAKREIQLNVSPQCLSKIDVLKISICSRGNDDAQSAQESPQKQLSTEIVESEQAEVIRLEAVKNLPTVTNKDYLADNVCKNISEISNADSRKSHQLNSSSNSSEDLSENAISDCTKTTDSPTEVFGFNSSLHPIFEKVAGNKRQVLKNTICSEKNESTNRKYAPSNFESTEKEGKNLPLSSTSDSSTEFLGFKNTYSERSSKGNGPTTNNNYVSSDCKSVEKKDKNTSEINNSQRRYLLCQNRIKSYVIFDLSEPSKKSSDSNQLSLGFKKPFRTDEISDSKKNHDDKNIPSNYRLEFLENFNSTEYLELEAIGLQRNLPTNENNVSNDVESAKRKNENVPLSCSSDSATAFSGNIKFTSTPTNQIFRRRRYYSSSDESDDSSPTYHNRTIVRIDKKNKRRKFVGTRSSSNSVDIVHTPRKPSKSPSTSKKKLSSTDDESYSSPVNTAKRDIQDSSKRKKFVRTSSSSDSEDVAYTIRKPSKSSSRSKNKLSSTEESYSSPVNTAKRDIKDSKSRKFIRTSSSSASEDIIYIPPNTSKSSSSSKKSSTDESYSDESPATTAKSKIKVSRRRKVEKIKKLRKYFTNVNVDLRRQKYFWRNCQLNVVKVLKWIQNKKNIDNLIEDPRALQREIEVYLEHLELNTSSIIFLNKRVTRSQTAAQRWQHFLKYGKTVKRWHF